MDAQEPTDVQDVRYVGGRMDAQEPTDVQDVPNVRGRMDAREPTDAQIEAQTGAEALRPQAKDVLSVAGRIMRP